MDNWIITHPHPDHMGAFNRIMQDDATSITIDHLYTVEFPLEAYEQIARDVDEIDAYYTFLDITQALEDKNILSVEYLHEGDILHPYYLNLHPSAVYADAPYFLYTGEQYKCKNTLAYLKDHDVACYTFHGAPHRVYVR